MKKFFLFLFLFTYNISIAQHSKEEIPSLVYQTLNFDFNGIQFYENKTLFLSIDTIVNKSSTMDFDYRQFTNTEDFLNEFHSLRPFFENKRIISFMALNNNSLLDSPKHWVIMLYGDNKIYNVRWWFSKYDINKIEGISISFIKKGNI
jgi:hypothetical protein